ncbi:MAG: hypothetical protein DHS20C16_10040 [Phycisphaerae bacterium]|nr:MAG: hypothetical protein DHS20C16_10040 [Phycisphaerae bacterium]
MFLLTFTLLLQIWGCKEDSKTSQPESAPKNVATIESASKPIEFVEPISPSAVRFAKGIFYKPNMDAHEDDVRMAPLIIREVNSSSDQPTSEFLGTLAKDSTEPAVFLFADTIELNGVTYKRLAHLWTYADSDKGTGALGCVQVVFNQSSEPVLWGVHSPRRAIDEVYVAKSVEVAAKREHGDPPTGRKFSVEKSRKASPIRVVRLLKDGPEPMGPMVYVADAPRRVAALACRCMDSQVDEILDAGFYRLIRSVSGDDLGVSITEQVQGFFESNGMNFDDRLEQFLSRDLSTHLRLPASL